MIEVRNIKIKPGENKDEILNNACKKMRIGKEMVKQWKILKQSLDARNKGNVFFIYSACFEVGNESKILRSAGSKDVLKHEEEKERAYEPVQKKRIVVVGFGPGGMFAALTLAKMGFVPLVLERGPDVDKRLHDVQNFWKTGKLCPESNVQFGEGGAGTFSDGKLTNRGRDPRARQVFMDFAANGAPEEILYVHNPHIGTDLLRNVVKNMREKIIALGGEIRFNAKVTDIESCGGQVSAVVVNGKERISCDEIILAIGHSARDTLEMLYENKISMSQKPFAMGVRIEHSQQQIDEAQLGKYAVYAGPAEYKLACRTAEGRGVYTFCMCPGGYVVAAASEEGMVCVNGMSNYKRDSENANSALLVQINTDDFGSHHPLAGMRFQRELEKKAFEAGGRGYMAPAQRVEDFLGTEEYTGSVSPTYRPGVVFCDLKNVLPKFMCEALQEGIAQMGKKLRGFDKGAVITAVESRSSSPVRINRNGETGESISLKGLYPVGEGAGYAGGIVSAAVDGIRAAENIYYKYKM